MSPSIADVIDDFPEPVDPTITTSAPCSTSMLIFFRKGGSSLFHVKSPDINNAVSPGSRKPHTAFKQ